MNGIKSRILIPLLIVLTAGCGGGGGGGGGTTLQPLAINQDNAMQVAAAILDVVAIVEDVGEGGVIPLSAAAVVTDDKTASLPEFTTIIRDQIDRFSLLHSPTTDFQIAALTIEPMTFDCLVGTYTISGKVADETGTTLSPGDTLNISFNNCDEGDGIVLNGKLSLVVVTGVDTDFTPPYDFRFDATVTNFSASGFGESFTMNGDLSLREAVSADGLFIETDASGNKLTVTGDGETETLTDYLIRGTLDVGAGDAYTADSGGLSDCCATLGSTILGGSVDFENLVPFAGVGENFPYDGILFITGGEPPSGIGASSLELHALDELCVNILIDEDGDGVNDLEFMTTWESLWTGVQTDCII